MIIRNMTLEDVAQVALIEQNCFSQPWSEQAFADSLTLPEAVFIVAEETVRNSCGDKAVVVMGYCGMYVSFEEGEITNVAVGECFRGQGIAKRLLEEMRKEAIKRNVERIVLEVRASNVSAIHLYKKMGFQKVGIRKGFYDKPKEDADIMMWEK